MRHFYDMTNVSISGRDLFAPSRLEDQPAVDWPLFSDNTSGVLARDKEAGYDLAKLAESLKNESVVYHSPSEAVLDDLIAKLQEFKLTKIEIGILLGIGLLLLSNIILAVTVKRHGHTLHKMALAILAVYKNIPMTDSFVLKSDPVKTTTESINALAVSPLVVSDWGPYWTNSLVLVVSFAITMGCLKVALSRRAYFYVDLTSQTESLQIKIAELPTAGRCYGLRTSQKSLKATIRAGWFGSRLSFHARHWFFYHLVSGTATALPPHTWLAPWTARKARRILLGEHVVTNFLVYTHHYIMWKDNPLTGSDAQAISNSGLVDGDDYNYHGESVV